jgi:tagatose kinase
MPAIWTMGEMLVEIMRPHADMDLGVAGEFLGPYPSGAPAIFIDTAARLGCTAGIIGGVGRDDFGKCLTDRLRKDGVDCRFVTVVDGMSSAVAFVTYFEDGSRKFIYHIGNTPAAMSRSPDLAGIEDPAFFHVMGCSLLASEPFRLEIIKTLEGFAAMGAKISFDPNIRVELLGARTLGEIIEPVMRHCAVLHPGVDELYMLAGVNDEARAVEKLFRNPRLEIIALKRGKKGCTVYTRDRSFSMGVYEVDPVDPTGAGDSFDAGFLFGLVEGKSLEECATIATAAAALNTAAFGPMEGNINEASMRAIMKGHLA